MRDLKWRVNLRLDFARHRTAKEARCLLSGRAVNPSLGALRRCAASRHPASDGPERKHLTPLASALRQKPVGKSYMPDATSWVGYLLQGTSSAGMLALSVQGCIYSVSQEQKSDSTLDTVLLDSDGQGCFNHACHGMPDLLYSIRSFKHP
jgi:hypothetical protein